MNQINSSTEIIASTTHDAANKIEHLAAGMKITTDDLKEADMRVAGFLSIGESLLNYIIQSGIKTKERTDPFSAILPCLINDLALYFLEISRI